MPATPTKAALERKPQAVVMQQFVSDHPNTVHTLSFEWFETDKGRIEWYDETAIWMDADVTQNGDIFYTITEVLDTSAMTLGRVQAYGPNDTWVGESVASVTADTTTLVAPAAAKRVAPKATPKAKIKGRAPSSAASAVKGPVEAGTEPKVKAKVVRKKIVAPQTGDEVKIVPPVAPTGAEKRAAALKERLAQKQAEGGSNKITAEDQIAVDKIAGIVQPSMGLARMRKAQRNR